MQILKFELLPELLTGSEVIDEHHKEFIMRINKFWGKDLSCQDDLEAYLAYLLIYAMEHFNFEEAIMVKTQFPGMAEHEKAHCQYFDKMDELRKSILASGYTLENKEYLYNLLSDWLTSHIKIFDIRLAEYLRKNNFQNLDT